MIEKRVYAGAALVSPAGKVYEVECGDHWAEAARICTTGELREAYRAASSDGHPRDVSRFLDKWRYLRVDSGGAVTRCAGGGVPDRMTQAQRDALWDMLMAAQERSDGETTDPYCAYTWGQFRDRLDRSLQEIE